MTEFLRMGGYAAWVWSAFGLTALILIINIMAATRRYQQALERLRRRMTRSKRSPST